MIMCYTLYPKNAKIELQFFLHMVWFMKIQNVHPHFWFISCINVINQEASCWWFLSYFIKVSVSLFITLKESFRDIQNYTMFYSPWRHPRCIWRYRWIQSELKYHLSAFIQALEQEWIQYDFEASQNASMNQRTAQHSSIRG